MPTRPPSRCPACRSLQASPGRCDTCRARQRAGHDARRGTARERGYDTQHDREGRAAKAQAVAEQRPCPRCGQPMRPGQKLDWGHTMARALDPTSRADRVEHARCNRVAQHYDG